MRYLVTGGTGFVGAYVVRELVAAGHTVSLFDIAPNREYLANVVGSAVDSVDVRSGDITDQLALTNAFHKITPDRVIHLAGVLGLRSDQDPLRAVRVNCEGTINIFELCLTYGVERVVWASSTGVFQTPGGVGDGPVVARTGPLPSDAPHRSRSFYGATKSFNEQIAAFYRRERKLDTVGVRFTISYGYGKTLTDGRGTRADFMAELLDRPAAGEPGRVPHGGAILDWLYIGDAARAVTLACDAPPPSSTALNICGHRATIAEVAEIVKGVVPDSDLEVAPDTWNDTNLWFDTEAARAEIGYEPAFSLRAGVEQTISDLRRFATS